MKPLNLVLLLSLLCSFGLQAAPLEDLREVGSARLKVLFWTVYDSTLYTEDGDYEGVEPGLALEITFGFNVPAAELIRRTAKEWDKRNLSPPEQSPWLDQLTGLLPDVNKGDTLVLYVDNNLYSNFYSNEQLSGTIADSDFTRNFLAIWLDEETDYPRYRRQLTGGGD